MIEANKQINTPSHDTINNNNNSKERDFIIEKSKLDKIIHVFSDIKDEICSWNWSEILCHTFQITGMTLLLAPIIIIALAVLGIIHPGFFIPGVIGLGISYIVASAFNGDSPGGHLTHEQQLEQDYIS